MNVDPIRRTILVRCTVDRAYSVFTNEMASWWPLDSHSRAVSEELDGVTAVGVEIEPRAGGRVLEKLSNGQELPWGEILAWEPPARLVIAWKPNASPLPPTELEITFQAEGEGTRVTLEHRGWERLGERAEEARTGYDEGWPMVFDRRYGAAAGAMVV